VSSTEKGARVALVTGAGSGIGAAVARGFSEKGAAVGLVGRTQTKLETIADEIRAGGGTAHTVEADLAEPDAPAAVVDDTLATLGRIDVIVNNAGTASVTPIDQVTAQQFDREFAVNVRAALLLVQAALPALRRSDSAAVVNVSSAAAWLYRPGQAIYGGSKAALEYLTRSLAAELAPDRIRVNCVVPGPVDTPILSQVADDVQAAKEHLVRMTPLGRLGTPEDVASWIVQLSEPAASWLTGAVLHVDGGRSLGPISAH
jgi:NAD(P)-dependent dehydrogenase (short-subunit alcohol dehydrogenase family)